MINFYASDPLLRKSCIAHLTLISNPPPPPTNDFSLLKLEVDNKIRMKGGRVGWGGVETDVLTQGFSSTFLFVATRSPSTLPGFLYRKHYSNPLTNMYTSSRCLQTQCPRTPPQINGKNWMRWGGKMIAAVCPVMPCHNPRHFVKSDFPASQTETTHLTST